MCKVFEIPANCPKILWHYTNINALFNIMKTRRFRATHFSFLNDAEEIKKGAELVLEIFKKQLSNTPDKNVFSDIVDHIESVKIANSPYGYYIISFSEENDLTTQWQAYTPQEGGCAIGFDSSKIVKAFSGVPNVFQEKEFEILWKGKTPVAPLCQCHYTTDTKLKEIRSNIEKTATNLINNLSISRALDNSERGDKAYIANNIGVFLPDILGVKHQCFEQEKEWRLVYFASDFKEVKYNENQCPYIELEISEDIKISDIIPEIKISPRGNKSATRKKLEILRADIEKIYCINMQPKIIISDSDLSLQK